MAGIDKTGTSRAIMIAIAGIVVVAIVVVAVIAMGLLGNPGDNHGGNSSDTTLPAIAIIEPTNEQVHSTMQNSIALSGTASDDIGVVSVTWSNNRGGSGTASGTISWAVTSISLSPGSNIITVKAKDAANNQQTDSITVNYVTIDTESPTITITSPTSNLAYSTSSSTIALSGTASDNIGVANITWSNDRGGSGTASGTTSWGISSLSLQLGVNIIILTVHDSSGNNGNDSITVTYDDQAPTVNITSPTSDSGYATVSLTIILGGTASDNVGLSSVTWSNNRGGVGVASGTTSWTMNPINLMAGANVIIVTASDALGNLGSDTITITCIPVDTQSSTVTITYPTNNQVYSTSSSIIALSGTAADNVGVTIVTWANDRGGSGIASGTSNWNTPSISLASGDNIITVSASDAAGNVPGIDTIIVTYSPPITDIYLSGNGDSITQMFDLTAGVTIFTSAHTGSGNFNIRLVTSMGVEEDLLVNEIGTYQGSTLIGVTSGSDVLPGTYYLNIGADGGWTVTISQPRPTTASGLPQMFTGISDKVPAPFTLTNGAIQFQMQYSGSSNFAVILYDSNGNYIDLLANEVGDYSGTTSVGVSGTGIYYLCITGIGSWSITVSHL